MPRRIRTTSLEATGGGAVDTYADRVVKYVPADIVAAWTAVIGIVKAAKDVPSNTVLWVCFLLGIIISLFWMLRQTKIAGRPLDSVAYWQSATATVAFIVWAFAIGGAPFESLPFYSPVYGSLLLIAFTLVSGLIAPPGS